MKIFATLIVAISAAVLDKHIQGGSQEAQISNQTPQVSNQIAQVSNQTPQVSNQTPQVSNQIPQVSNQINHEGSGTEDTLGMDMDSMIAMPSVIDMSSVIAMPSVIDMPSVIAQPSISNTLVGPDIAAILAAFKLANNITEWDAGR